jgi:hypothetical protein
VATPITGATGQTYQPAAADLGHPLSVQVTATNAGGSAVETSAATAAVGNTRVPTGPSGSWNQIFNDDFLGTSLNTNAWSIITSTDVNNVTPSAANVEVSGGYLGLTLSSSSVGAAIVTGGNERGVTAPNGVMLAVGDYMEAYINFPGYTRTTYTPHTDIPYNWPAWWASTYSTSSSHEWPVDGEIDCFEGLNGSTAGYHYGPGGAATQTAPDSGPIYGSWVNAFHRYGALRGQDTITYYWDGGVVWSTPRMDAGGPESILLNVGSGEGPAMYGAASQVLVDYVTVWSPA